MSYSGSMNIQWIHTFPEISEIHLSFPIRKVVYHIHLAAIIIYISMPSN